MLRNLIALSAVLLWLSPLPSNADNVVITPSSEDQTKSAGTAKPERPLSYWFRQLASADPSLVRRAKKALSSDMDFIRPQMDTFRYPDDDLRRERIRGDLRPILPQLLDLMDHTDTDIRSYAFMATACIGPDASAAKPKLLKIIQSPSNNDKSRLSAAVAMYYITPRHVPVGPEIWSAFCRAPLQNLRGPLSTAEEQLENDAFSAAFLAVTLHFILVETNRTVTEIPTLAQAAKTTTLPRSLRWTILELFVSLGKDARAAIPAVVELLKDSDPTIRTAAAMVLISSKKTPAEGEEVIRSLEIDDKHRALLRKGLKRHFEEKAREIKENLNDKGEDSSRDFFTELLADELQSPFHFRQRQAIEELGKLGELAKWAVPDLVKLLNSPEAYTREEALIALQLIAPDALPQSAFNDVQRPYSETWRGQSNVYFPTRLSSRGNRAFARHQRRRACR